MAVGSFHKLENNKKSRKLENAQVSIFWHVLPRQPTLKTVCEFRINGGGWGGYQMVLCHYLVNEMEMKNYLIVLKVGEPSHFLGRGR